MTRVRTMPHIISGTLQSARHSSRNYSALRQWSNSPCLKAHLKGTWSMNQLVFSLVCSSRLHHRWHVDQSELDHREHRSMIGGTLSVSNTNNIRPVCFKCIGCREMMVIFNNILQQNDNMWISVGPNLVVQDRISSANFEIHRHNLMTCGNLCGVSEGADRRRQTR